MKVLVATGKPFSKEAVAGIKSIVEGSNNEFILLESYKENSELLEAVKDVEAIIIRSDKITAEVVEAAKNLKIVVRAGAGYDNVDLEACTAKGIVVMNTPGQNSNAVAELVIALMIFINRGQFTPKAGKEVSGKKLGIQAFGNVGRIVGRYAKGLGMEVYAFDPFITDKSVFTNEGVTEVSSLEELYSTCDVISLHIPATPKTINSINYDLLSRMPKGATLINTARKEVINEAELVKLMAEREDFKYIADIAPNNAEELTEKFGNRFFATPKKMGAQTAEANLNAGIAAATQIINFFTKGDRKFQVNK
ncbi:MAG: 3-phosphoglycerate dehydrogenase [Bacteroidetes bacterium]|nr:3-phosphoglycerate dehydrogenase [Bacteroidota bacterium]